jgi:FxsC-like protein
VLYFFLSYARGNDDPYVERFFQDLCDEVRVLTGERSSAEVGFLDTHVTVGSQWSASLVDALSRCGTFIALCSPAYFLSEPCGKEWEIFAQRARRSEAMTGSSRSALLPVLWLPQRTVPLAAQAVQYVNDTSGDSYASRGLRQMLRLQRHRDDYRDLLTQMAERIVHSARTGPPPSPPDRIDFDQVASAFHSRDTPARPTDAAAIHLGPPTPQAVQFMVAAGSASEISTVRHDLRYYGDLPEHWSPYHPETTRSIAAVASGIAADSSFEARIVDLSQLDECLEVANRNNEIVVMLLDPWSIRLSPHREILRGFDRQNEAAAAVMVPWNLEDEETRENAPELTETLNATFPNHTQRRDQVMFRSRILTQSAFHADLRVVLEVARNRLFARGTVYRRPASIGTPRRPILEGP